MLKDNSKVIGGPWLNSFIHEMKWSAKVKKSIQAINETNIKFPTINQQRKVLIACLVFLLVPRCRFLPIHSCVTVGFSLDIGSDSKYFFIDSRINLKSLIAGVALHEFLALHYLLNSKHIFNKKIRKLFIRIFISSILKNQVYLRSYQFIVTQDYFGRSSCLVSFMDAINLSVIGLQHGLMPIGNLMKSNIYPGFRLRQQLVFNKTYKKYFKSKNPNSEFKILGPPWNIQSREFLGKTTICFVSHGVLHEKQTIKILENIQITSETLDCSFLIRPHPQELKSVIKNNMINFSSKEELIDSKIPYIFIGVYSTFMYWAAFNGFKTIWIRELPCGPMDEEMISKWPNVFFMDIKESIDDSLVKKIIEAPYQSIEKEIFHKRIDEIIDGINK
ncbi:hypothetical protein G6728_01770 [Polynucleobacter paneuropaeus]|nr:hypothetical protein G6728_01770 [Polynucleobacter paneuropaeus]